MLWLVNYVLEKKEEIMNKMKASMENEIKHRHTNEFWLILEVGQSTVFSEALNVCRKSNFLGNVKETALNENIHILLSFVAFKQLWNLFSLVLTCISDNGVKGVSLGFITGVQFEGEHFIILWFNDLLLGKSRCSIKFDNFYKNY